MPTPEGTRTGRGKGGRGSGLATHVSRPRSSAHLPGGHFFFAVASPGNLPPTHITSCMRWRLSRDAAASAFPMASRARSFLIRSQALGNPASVPPAVRNARLAVSLSRFSCAAFCLASCSSLRERQVAGVWFGSLHEFAAPLVPIPDETGVAGESLRGRTSPRARSGPRGRQARRPPRRRRSP